MPYTGYFCETCLRHSPEDPPANKCPACSGDPVPFAALNAKSQARVRGEYCPGCLARMEKGDSGKCNRCGGLHKEAAPSPVEAARLALQDMRASGTLPPPRPRPPGVLGRLLQAKEESDRRNYDAKHQILRELIMKRPRDFAVDSDDGKGIVGVTHARTGFRVHMPKALAAGLIPGKPAASSGAGPYF